MKVADFLAASLPAAYLPEQLSWFSHSPTLPDKKITLLSEVTTLSKQKSQFVTKDKIQLNFKRVAQIDELPSQYQAISKLYLANNELASLKGLEQFNSLTHLSIAHNFLFSLQELQCLQSPQLLQSLSIKGNFFTKHPNHRALIVQYFPNLVDLDCMTVTDQMVQNIQDGLELRRLLVPFFLKIRRLSDRFVDFVNKMKMKLQLKQRRGIHTNQEDMQLYVEIDEQYQNLIGALQNPIFRRKQPYLAPKQLVRVIESIGLESETLFMGEEIHKIEQTEATRRQFKEIFKWLFSEIILNLNMTRSNELTNYLNYLILCNDPRLFRILLERVLASGNLEKENRDCMAHSSNILHAILTEPKRRSEIIHHILKLMLSSNFIDTERLYAEQIKQFYLLQPNQSRIVDSFILLEGEKIKEKEEEAEESEEIKVEEAFQQKYVDIATNNEYIHDYGEGARHPFHPRDRGPFEITGQFKKAMSKQQPPRLRLDPFPDSSYSPERVRSLQAEEDQHPLLVTLGSGEIIQEAAAEAEVSGLMGGPSIETAASLLHNPSPGRSTLHQSTRYDSEFLDEQLLYEFPVFPLNHEYL